MLPARFWNKVNKNGPTFQDLGPCWLWQASISGGYGRFHFEGKTRSPHQLAYEDAGLAIPSNMEIDHLCRRTACCNPAHLEAVPHRVNIQRNPAHHFPDNGYRDKTECIHGHAYTPENTITNGPHLRQCRICHNETAKKYRARKGLAKVSLQGVCHDGTI